MASLLSAELAATCNALGYYDAQRGKYYADTNTLETVKDLIRYLRRDDDTFDIRRQLGETKVVQTDLLPLLKSYWQETDLFDVLLRLLVNLTTPALMLWQEEIPSEKTARNHYLQIEEHLRLYKQAFADETIWAVLSTRISKILEVDPSERPDEDGLIIERILILIRNVLYVPADPDAEKRPDNDASVHDQVLWALHQSGMLDIILYMTSSTTEQAYYMHILEILSYMLREQSASELANAALQRSETEKMRDEAELVSMRHRENNKKHQKLKQYTGTRHSRFGGTFVVKSMKSISDNELIYHKPLNKLDALNFDVDKKKSKTPRNRLPVQSTSVERRSAFSIRLFLKEFCVEFLNGAYNTLMYHVKDRLARARAQQHDESYYLWALRFFMEFNRCYKFEVKLVSETMSVQSFHFVQRQMENYFDMISTDKKKIRQWAKRLHLALLAYKELLMTIWAMDKSPDGTVRDSARVIKSNVFYVLEYRELVLTLMVTFDELKLPMAYLRDLLETQHVFLKMLELYCGGKSGRAVVQAKAKARRRKKAVSAAAPAPTFNLESMWDEASPQLSVVLEGPSNIPNVVPFDACSDVPIDEQKSDAMKNIQRKLRAHEFEEAVGLLRAAREVWPENDDFGTANMAAEEEFMALRDVFFADLGENKPAAPEVTQEPEDEYEEDEEDELQDNLEVRESDLKFEDFAKRLAHPKIVRACGLALANFETNSVSLNHCIVKLLHRIAFDCKMAAMLFQVSIFRSFQKIFAAKGVPQYKELIKFATYIIREFFKVASKNEHVYMEALFWKSSADAYDIEMGYGTYSASSKASARAWSEEQEDELRLLFEEHQRKELEEDVVDWVTNNLVDKTRNRRGVIKKLKEMGLLMNYKPRKSGVTGRIPREWGEEEAAQLRELYEQFKDAMDPLTCIMERLDVHRPKNRIAEKLLVMGLVQDKKELRKKRAGKSAGRARRNSESSSGEDDIAGGRDGSPGHASRGSSRTSNPSAAKRSRKTKKAAKSSGHVRVSSGDLAKMLISLADGDAAEALEWLRESFSDAVEDLENDPQEGDDGIPLVPIMDCAVSAMENEEFLKLLRAFGVQEPADEQETYWRIPTSLSAADLRAHCELLTQAIDKTLETPEEIVPSQTQLDQGESSDEDVFDKLRKMTAANNSQEENHTPFEPKKDLIKNIAKTKPSVDFELVIEGEPSSAPRSDRRRIRMADSSDEEPIEEREEVEDSLGFRLTRIEDSDSDGEARVTSSSDARKFKSMAVIQSDDDEEEKVESRLDSDAERIEEHEDSNYDNVARKKIKNTAVIQSDGDDEDEKVENRLDSEAERLEEHEDNAARKSIKNMAVIQSDGDEDAEVDENDMNIGNGGEKENKRSLSDSDAERPKAKKSRIISSDEED